MNTNIQYLTSILEKLPPDDSRMLLQFAEFLAERQPHVISAQDARRQVSAWLVREVGNLLLGGSPELIPGIKPVWRVPVVIPGNRHSPAGDVEVDAYTGKLLVDESTPRRILDYVQAIAVDTTSR